MGSLGFNSQGQFQVGGHAVNYGKNYLINGGMQIGQRGSTVFTSTNNLYGWIDRWLISISGTTVSALGYQGESTSVLSGKTLQVGNVTTTGATTIAVSQRLESIGVCRLNGKTITVSGKMMQTTGTTQTASLNIRKANSLDNFSATTSISVTSISVPHNTWTPFEFTCTLGALDASNGISFIAAYNALSTLTNAQFHFGDIQLEEGSVATPWTPYSGEFGGEVQACARYYEKLSNIYIDGLYAPAAGSSLDFSMKITPKRASPTITQLSATPINSTITYSGYADGVLIMSFLSTATGRTGADNISLTASAEL